MYMEFKRTIPFILAAVTLLIIVILLGACAQKSGTGNSTSKSGVGQTTAGQVGQYKKISPADAKALMDGGNVIILDVRTQEEFDQGHIKDAVLLPDYEIGAKAATVLPDKDAKILVYCRSGNRSASAAKELIKMGYTDVMDFGGIIDWPYDVVQ